jgi:hypothetical protein
MVLAVVPFSHLVLTAAVHLAATGLVALAHLDSLLP